MTTAPHRTSSWRMALRVASAVLGLAWFVTLVSFVGSHGFYVLPTLVATGLVVEFLRPGKFGALLALGVTAVWLWFARAAFEPWQAFVVGLLAAVWFWLTALLAAGPSYARIPGSAVRALARLALVWWVVSTAIMGVVWFIADAVKPTPGLGYAGFAVVLLALAGLLIAVRERRSPSK